METEITVAAKSSIRLKFFELLFADVEGYLCLAYTDPRSPKTTFEQRFFKWPVQSIKAEEWILEKESQFNLYFCVNILKSPERKKGKCIANNILWADLDNVSPAAVSDQNSDYPPPIVVRSSPGRWQAYWRLSTKVEPYQAEDYSRRLAYLLDADKSGWDMTQLLRVPMTVNFKYDKPVKVDLERALETTAVPLLFEKIPAHIGIGEIGAGLELAEPVPKLNETHTAQAVIYKYNSMLQHSAFFSLYSQDPGEDADWSSTFWSMLHQCYRCGMSPEEVFTIAREAKCNKYNRDGRPVEHVWKDILKAGEDYKHVTALHTDLITMPALIAEQPSQTFIDEYRSWAVQATDAVPEFHDLAMFVVLSAIISSSVKVETSAGNMTPNIWGLILGESTLTRKTTAMKLAMEFLMQMDPELVVATDGTAEGILSALSLRPNRSSIYFKDEVSGLFDSMMKKDYLAGLQETLTALYDSPSVYTRRLKKETIVIESPAFVFIGGGVTDRVYSAVDEQFVLSGFLPRFLVVYGDAAPETRRPLGPPTESGAATKPIIAAKLADLYETYCSEVVTKIGGQKVRMPARVTAKLTEAAWAQNAEYETIMLEAGSNSLLSDLALPTFDRMSRSLLKMAAVLAAVRQVPIEDPEDGSSFIIIERDDVRNAAWYVQKWGQNSIDLIVNAGKGKSEKMIDKILEFVTMNPGITKSEILRRYHMSSQEGRMVIETMEERALLKGEKRGAGMSYWAVQ